MLRELTGYEAMVLRVLPRYTAELEKARTMAEFDEAIQAAVDRFEDLKTDPLD